MKLKANKKTSRLVKKNPSMGLFILTLIIIVFNYATIALFTNVRGINMKEFAANRNRFSTTLKAKRGTIYDFEGNILAQNVTSYTVVAILSDTRTVDPKKPQHVVDKKLTAEKLSPLINMEKEDILDLLNTKDVYQVELGPGGRGITELVKDEIEKLGLPGITFEESYKRFYPNGDFASYIIGYAKVNETVKNEKVEESIDGELGIELLYDDDLKGTDGYLEYEQDLNGYKLPDTKEIRKDAVDGYDIYLTIDSNIQRFVDDALADSYKEYNPEWMLFYVMDAKTGDILAGSSYPSFDPNERDLVNYENPLVSYEYEPGSVMKTFTYMCAIDKGTYNGNDTYESGSITLGDTKIYDVVKSGWGTLNFDEGYKHSSNVAIAYLMQRFINRDDLYNCFKSYGFGKNTGIELPRELKGSISFSYPYDTAAAGFGQGIYTTPIQQLQGLSILTNNGKKLTPHIISKIVDEDTKETIYEREVEESEQLVKKSTVEYMKDLMGGVYAALYKIDGYDIAGKTGTAEVYNSELKRYVSGENIFSYSAIYPKEDPEVIIFTSSKFKSGGSHYATSDAFKRIIKSIAKYYNLNEDQQSLKNYEIKSYISKKVSDVTSTLKNDNIDYYVIGNGNYIVNQYPNKDANVIENDKIFLLTNYDKLTMPNMTGWSRNDCITFSNLTGINISIEGNGYVYTQNIFRGNTLNKNSKVKVALK